MKVGCRCSCGCVGASCPCTEARGGDTSGEPLRLHLLRLFPSVPQGPGALQEGLGSFFPFPYKVVTHPRPRSTVWLDVALIHWLDMDWGFDRKINQTFDCSVSDCLCASASTHERNLEELHPKGDPAGCAEGRKEKVPQLCVLLGPGAPSDQPHSCVPSRGLRFQTRAHSALWRLEIRGSHM